VRVCSVSDPFDCQSLLMRSKRRIDDDRNVVAQEMFRQEVHGAVRNYAITPAMRGIRKKIGSDLIHREVG
jgi:hypothetical protein